MSNPDPDTFAGGAKEANTSAPTIDAKPINGVEQTEPPSQWRPGHSSQNSAMSSRADGSRQDRRNGGSVFRTAPSSPGGRGLSPEQVGTFEPAIAQTKAGTLKA